MKLKSPRSNFQSPPRLFTHCSVVVLASLGLLGGTSSALGQAAKLPAGTLPVLRGVVGGNAVATVNAPVGGATTRLLTVDQFAQNAIINWKSFNISSDAEVRFNQPGPTATALNRIYSADPSVIQGKLSANGQVLLINQNGILFGAGAQVNVQALVASTLNMSNEQFTKNSGSLTADGIARDAKGNLAKPAFAGGYAYDDDQGVSLPTRPDGARPADIVLGNGGLSGAAPTLTAKAGGSIVLIAPRIDNQNALITAPDGQVMLAAGAKVYLALPDDKNIVLRGMMVEVEASEGVPVNLSDMIRNAGTLSADRGNVTLASMVINQEGRVTANTAIQANGSIYLQATSRTAAGEKGASGKVLLAAGSVTQVLPDAADKATLPESESFLTRRGVINIDARLIESYGSVNAPGGRIALTASDALDATAARVYLGQGSTTSVAGGWVDLPFDSNLLTLRVTSNELKDSPDQKNGVLRGATVTVDLRKANPTLDLTGYLNAKARTVGEKTAEGGELSIASSGDIIQRQGATLDASGGGYRYGAGTVATSWLLGEDGKLYDIGTAPKDRTYKAVADTFTKTYQRWGQTEVFTGLLYGAGRHEAASVEGKRGGTIAISSKGGLVLDGTLRGGATAGPNQLTKAPQGASLAIGGLNLEGTDFAETQRIGNVRFTQTAVNTLGDAFGVDSTLSDVQRDRVTLAASQLFGAASTPDVNTYEQASFGTVEINSNGNIVVPQGVSLEGAPGSELLLRAPGIEVAGQVKMPAGKITLTPQISLEGINADQTVGTVVRSGALLSTEGVWINTASTDGSYVGDVLPSGRLRSDGTTRSLLNGGEITIAGPASSITRLEAGSTLDVGGGGAIDRSRKVTNGNGGALSITNARSLDLTSDWMQADLLGFAAGNGGTLAISTPRVVIEAADAAGVLPADTTRLSPELFSEHGFSDIRISSLDGLAVRSGAQLAVQQKNLVIDSLKVAGLATGGDLSSAATVQRLPDHLRQSANLTLATGGVAEESIPALTLEQGASITLDPNARLNLSAVNGMRIDGRISAPGGSVTMRLAAPVNVDTPDLTLGSTASVSVAGTFIAQPNTNALNLGKVVGAGSITLQATNAGVDVQQGASLDLSGVSRVLDVPDASAASGQTPRRVDGNAGTLVVKSQGVTRLDGTLAAASASNQGAGGSFALEVTAPDGKASRPDERRLVLSGAGAALDPQAGYVDSAVSIDALKRAGFDKLRLLAENSIRFDGDMALDFKRGVRLDAPLLDVLNDSKVTVAAASVSLGQSLGPRDLQGVTFELVPTVVSPTLATRAGAGTLAVQAGSIDLFGSITVNGVAETALQAAGDIQLSGRRVDTLADGAPAGKTGTVGSFTTAGNLSLTATQVYPSTRTDYSFNVVEQPAGAVRPGGVIRVASSGQTAGDVYSVGGTLTLNADTILQGGTLKAPQGALNLLATTRLDLAEGSVTSVSAHGLTVPLGTTKSGIDWLYVDGVGATSPLDRPSSTDKSIQLAGDKVSVNPGATVDIAGGGEVQAIEWVAGSGGSSDTLLKPNTYAIIPKSRLTSMPVDTDIASRQDMGFGPQTASRDTSVYDGLYIGAGAVVPEGEYVLLPGRYALLPGAYLVQLQTGSTYANLQPRQTVQLTNGQTVVSGYRTARGTGVRESTTVGVLVRPGTDALRESDYTLSGSSFFAAAAESARKPVPRLPIDAGKLTIANVSELTLAGDFKTQAGTLTNAAGTTTGRVGAVDLVADRIAVVDTVGQAGIDSDFLQVGAADISRLGGSVLIGGRRSDSVAANGSTPITQITTGASRIVVANQAASELKAPELLFAATDEIELRSGSVLNGAGTAVSDAKQLLRSEAGGALLRLSSGAQASVDRGAAVDSSTGTISVAQGATLQADGSMLLDATRNTRSQGTLLVGERTVADGVTTRHGGALSLASSKVSLGETDGVVGLDDGLVLSNASLLALTSVDALLIKGYGGIDLIGAAAVGSADLGLLTLDASAIRGGAGAQGSTVRARQVQLVNSGTASGAFASGSHGSLGIEAGQRLVIGEGAKTISGFDSVTTTAGTEILGAGKGSLQVAADWTLQSPGVTVAAGAQQLWQAVDNASGTPDHKAMTLRHNAGSTAAAADSTAAGGRLQLEGRRVDVSTTVQARSGVIGIASRGTDAATDGVTLGAGGVLDARGMTKDHAGNVAVASAGRVELSADAGPVVLGSGATVDVRGVAGGDSGSLRIVAPELIMGAALKGEAASTGAGARFVLDAGALGSSTTTFSDLNTALNQGGFNEQRDIRVRSGNLAVLAGDVVTSRTISLAADAGRIDIAGTLDAQSVRGGGKVDVWAANGLALTGASVRAGGTSTGADAASPVSNGGVVRLSTASGSLEFDAASTIDVRPGAKGATGSVTFTVARDDSDSIASPVSLRGTVLGKRGSNGTDATVTLQAQRVYDVVDGALDVDAYAADHERFMSSVDTAAWMGSLQGDVSAHVRGATELRAAGDLTISNAWDLTTSQWLAGGEPGTLTLRSGGNLTVLNALGSPDDNILDGDTWNIRLVGGADLNAANPLATQRALTAQALAAGAGVPVTGHVVLSTDSAKVRTGTGSIEIAAAADFQMDALKSVVYTAGKTGQPDADVNGNKRWAQGGGSISVQAGRDAVGNSAEWITEWLRRPKLTASSAAASYGDWWAYRANFRQGLGTLGGGDIALAAGRDVDGLSAMLPTTGRHDLSGDVPVLDVAGGGDLRIVAGNDVRGGSYLVARGTGRIDAGGEVGAGTRTQLYLQGVSSGDVPDEARIRVEAGQGVYLQSVNNPTAVYMLANTKAQDKLSCNVRNCPPSFGSGSAVRTFFTYSGNSGIDLMAKSGDLLLGSELADVPSLANQAIPAQYRTGVGAYPASLRAVALEGNISSDALGGIVSYPSASAKVALLAQGSLLDMRFTGSDLDASLVANADQPNKNTALLTGAALVASGSQRRVVQRDDSAGYVFDLQAVSGKIDSTSDNTVTLSLPAVSRVSAGQDIGNVALLLQNLNDADLSVVQARTGDIHTAGIEIAGPGRLLVQAGRHLDLGAADIVRGSTRLGGIVASGNSFNASQTNDKSAQVTIVAGVTGNLDLAKLDASYDIIKGISQANGQGYPVDGTPGATTVTVVQLLRVLDTDPQQARVLSAASVEELAAADAAYAPFKNLAAKYPQLLATYQAAARSGSLPLGGAAAQSLVSGLYGLLNAETDKQAILNARSLSDLQRGTKGGSAYAAFAALDGYPRVLGEYQLRLGNGVPAPLELDPVRVVYADVFKRVIDEAIPAAQVGQGDISSYLTSIQSYGGSGIDLWAPNGNITVGLTTPDKGRTIGVLTNTGGAIRSVVSGNFNINQGKVLTAQGGDILILSTSGNIDAGRGALTSLSTPPPTRKAVTVTPESTPEDPNPEPVVIGYTYTLPPSISGSGIQTLTSDPDGLGPRTAPTPGSTALITPAGVVDAGEAGIRSGGAIFVDAQAVLNSSNISSAGPSVGVPVTASGSLAASVASSGSNTNTSKSGEDAANSAAAAARAAAAAEGMQKPSILTVEVMGFGEKNCKETAKDCLGK